MARTCKRDHVYDPRHCASCRAWRGIEDPTLAMSDLPHLQRNVRCEYLGDDTGERITCPSCTGHVQLKVFSCGVHGTCTLRQKVEGTACCYQDCQHYLPAGHKAAPPLFELGQTRVDDPLRERGSHPLTRTAERDRHTMSFRALQARLSMQPVSLAGQGDGLLLVGGGRYWPGIVVAVRMLRASGCRLPVQVWHRGSAESVYPEDLDDPLVSYHDATQYPHRRLGGWETKSLALLYCGLERVLYLDADAYFVEDPTPLLDMVSADRPIAFWTDLPGTEKNVKWDWEPVKNTANVPPIQGGQLVFHRPGFATTLLLTHWLNQHSEYYYSQHFGDQDSWRVAMAATDVPYCALGMADWRRVAFICRHDGKDYVVHRCQAKLMVGRDLVTEIGLPCEDTVAKLFQEYRYGGSPARVFSRIYRDKDWGEGSGAGSTPAAAEDYLRIINAVLSLGQWQSVVDLGFGDGYIVSRLTAERVSGVDCCKDLVEAQQQRQPEKAWLCLDLLSEREQLPSGDLALLKDVLQHWPSALIQDWLRWATQSGKWHDILITNSFSLDDKPRDCALGDFRPLSARVEPLAEFKPVLVARYGYQEILRIRCSGSQGD